MGRIISTQKTRPFGRLILYLEAAPRFELGIELLQSSALPLGYAATFDILSSIPCYVK